MRGTLFSSDYVFDTNGDAKLVEIHTDTGFISSSFNTSNWDSTDFINLLSTNSITKVHVVYKQFQNTFVDWLDSEIQSSAHSASFTRHIENDATIYPELITNTSDSFILRLAYDESAILDSTYCKNKTNLLNLFNDATASDYVPPFYSSGSGDSLLSSSVNHITSSLPDVVIKSSIAQTPVQFVKLGNQSQTTGSLRYQALINEQDNGEYNHIEKFIYREADLSDNRLQTIRSFDILHFEALDENPNISLTKLGRYRVQSIFEIPASGSVTYSGSFNDDNIQNNIDVKHSYEFGTKFPQNTKVGIWGGESYLDAAGTGSLFATIAVSGSAKAFYIDGAPNTEITEEILAWSFTGSTLPSNSFTTNSVVESVESVLSPYKVVAEVNLDSGNSIYATDNKMVLAYNTGSNLSAYVHIHSLTNDNYLYKTDGTLDHVSSSYMIVSNDDVTIVNPNVEDTDTFIISGSDSIVHNCFVAGTKVHTEQGVRNIEDVKVGDKVISYNHDNDVVEYKEVLQTSINEDEKIIKYVFENGTEISCTPGHPFFVISKGYCSFTPEITNQSHGIEVEQIEIGDEVLHLDGYGVTISEIIDNGETEVVYNLKEVKGNHNFFVEDLLVHNKLIVPICCFKGSVPVQLGNGEFKAIKDIEVGDMVRVYDHVNNVYTSSAVTELHNYTNLSQHADENTQVSSSDELAATGSWGYWSINGNTDVLFTPEHPFLTKEGWKSLVPDPTQEPYLTEQEPKTLGVGDFVHWGDEWNEIQVIDFVTSSVDETVYNITVEKYHSYLVDGLVVHNK